MSMKEALRREIRAYVARASAAPDTATSWEEALVGFVDVADPGLDEVCRLLGPSHAMPRDLMPTAASVVALFVPYTRDLARSNRKGESASRAWCVAFDETRRMLQDLGLHLQTWLAERGHELKAIPESHGFDSERVAADWSHKHMALLAGLGRPGHHTMLITPRGCFGRAWTYLSDVSSALVDVPSDSDQRIEHEPCMTLAGRECLRCVVRSSSPRTTH